MSQFFLVGIFFLRHSEEVSVDLFNFTVRGLAEKDEDVIALGEFSGLDRQRGVRPIFAEPDFTDPAAEDFPPFDGLHKFSDTLDSSIFQARARFNIFVSSRLHLRRYYNRRTRRRLPFGIGSRNQAISSWQLLAFAANSAASITERQ
jgi:hypothetical protein